MECGAILKCSGLAGAYAKNSDKQASTFLFKCSTFVLMKIQRIRDPIHGLIVFDDDGLVDEQVWALLNTSDMQRLRRIKQLGVSEFVFPSASHTRFSHSVGVFHNARRLVNIIKREIGLKRVDGDFNRDREACLGRKIQISAW